MRLLLGGRRRGPPVSLVRWASPSSAMNTSDPRVFFAAERTLLAWLRTGLTLIGLGFRCRSIWFIPAGIGTSAAERRSRTICGLGHPWCPVYCRRRRSGLGRDGAAPTICHNSTALRPPRTVQSLVRGRPLCHGRSSWSSTRRLSRCKPCVSLELNHAFNRTRRYGRVSLVSLGGMAFGDPATMSRILGPSPAAA